MEDAEIERELAEELGVGKMFKEWHEFPIMCEGELIVLEALVKERRECRRLEEENEKLRSNRLRDVIVDLAMKLKTIAQPEGKITATMVADLRSTFDRLYEKYGRDWTEWTDVHGAIRKLESSLNQQLASSEARGEPAEIVSTLRGVFDFLRELSGSAMLAGEKYSASDRQYFYSEACSKGNHVMWAIDQLTAVSTSAGRAEPQCESIKDPANFLTPHPFGMGAASAPEPAKKYPMPYRGTTGHYAEHLSTHVRPPSECSTCLAIERDIAAGVYEVRGATAPAPTEGRVGLDNEFSDREEEVIQAIMQKMDLSRQAVLRYALRTLQLAQSGDWEMREINPTLKAEEPSVQPGTETAQAFAARKGFGAGMAKHYPPVLKVMSQENAWALAEKFAEQRLSAMRAATIEECAEVMCKWCKEGYKAELLVPATNAWFHFVAPTHVGCWASAIRSLSSEIAKEK